MNQSLSLEQIRKIGEIPMYFVVGAERSGTTLLQVMLNAHPEIVAPPESKFIILLHKRYGSVNQWTEQQIRDFCKDIYKEGLLKKLWGIDREELLSSCLAAQEIATFQLLCKLVFYHASQGKNPRLFIDKNPVYYYAIPELQTIFPEAKFIHIVRDFRANLNSYKQVFRLKKPADIAYRWMKSNILIEKSRRTSPGDYHTVKYEELVNTPELTMRGICEFIGMSYNEKMVTDHASGIYPSFFSNNKDGFMKFYGKLFQPIDSAGNDAWKSELSTGEVADAEAVAGKFGLRYYGYKISLKQEDIENHINKFILKLKYNLIKEFDMLALFNPWLYFNMRGAGVEEFLRTLKIKKQ